MRSCGGWGVLMMGLELLKEGREGLITFQRSLGLLCGNCIATEDEKLVGRPF